MESSEGISLSLSLLNGRQGGGDEKTRRREDERSSLN